MAKIFRPGKTGIVCFLLIFVASGISFGQEVEHNYPVGPSKTNCDSLRLEGLSIDEALEKILNTTFRFQQKFNYSRLSGVQAGAYYSCDGKFGFLSIMVDKKRSLYRDVPKKTWEDLIASGDPDTFYAEKIKQLYAEIKNR